MDLLNAIFGHVTGTSPDEWADVVTAGPFDERTIVSHGLFKSDEFGPGAAFRGNPTSLVNGTLLYVPENTAAYVFSQGGIEQILTEPGGYVFDGYEASPYYQTSPRPSRGTVAYGESAPQERRIAFVNLRELRNISFASEGPIVYNDTYYDADLEIEASGSFSVRVTDTERLLRQFVPPNVLRYSFDFPRAREQVVDEFLQSLVVALDSLSCTYRVSQLPAHSHEITQAIMRDSHNVGSWPERFGFRISAVAIEKIILSEASRNLVLQFNAQRLVHKAAEPKAPLSFEEQAKALRTWKALLDDGVITKEEFEDKKRQILMS